MTEPGKDRVREETVADPGVIPDGVRSPAAISGFDGYRIIRELGRGGMGIVYLAEEISLRRRLAIKMLPHSVAAEPKVVQRFLREAQAAARLRHPNIISVYTAGEQQGTYYYSMEYIPGVPLSRILTAMREQRLYKKGGITLRRIMEEGLQTLELITEPSGHDSAAADVEVVLSFSLRNYVHETLRLFAEAADALDYAHNKGVIHRDIKPSNLLLAPDGRLMVADFGLAKVGDARSITRTGDLVGSPSYMSPEQAMTRRSKLDHRTDIWSLGVTLYEFLTLRHPFEAKNLELSFQNILNAEPTSPRTLNPRLPKDVETIIQKCLEKNYERRYATAADLAADLRSVLRYESIQARSTSPIQLGIRFVHRHRIRLTLAVLATLLVGVGAKVLLLEREKNLADVDLAIAYFEGLKQALPTAPDPEVVSTLQAAIREARRAAPRRDLTAALDVVAMSTLRQAEEHLPNAADVGQLREVVSALSRLKLLSLHQRDAQKRAQMQVLDRASAELRVRLVWALADDLTDISPGDPSVDSKTKFRWLLQFLGTRPDQDGIARERNPLVRRNAVVAAAGVARDPRFAAGVKQGLAEVLRSTGDPDEAVESEALIAISSIVAAHPGAGDGEMRKVASERIRSTDRARVSALARYHVVGLLASDRARYQGDLEWLSKDAAIAVSERAQAVLAE